MFKIVASALIVTLSFALLLGLLISSQPSPQDAALSALITADKLLDGLDSPDVSSRISAERKLITDPKTQKLALAELDELQNTLVRDQLKLKLTASQLKTQISNARTNLASQSAVERLRAVRAQFLAVIWPLLVAGTLLYFVLVKKPEDWLQKLATVVSNVKIPGGTEISFVSAAVKISQEETLRGYRKQVIDRYDAVAAQYQIADTAGRIVKDIITPFFVRELGKAPDFRCTIHVQDMLFQNSLYQLIDYLPRKWSEGGKGGRGRAWSARYGLLGRYWRLEESGFQHAVPTSESDLIKQWGMTKSEAEGASGRQTLFCALIRATNQSPLAMLYLDAEPKDAFGDDDKMKLLQAEVDGAVRKMGLDTALEKVWQDIRSSAPLIEIYGRK